MYFLKSSECTRLRGAAALGGFAAEAANNLVAALSYVGGYPAEYMLAMFVQRLACVHFCVCRIRGGGTSGLESENFTVGLVVVGSSGFSSFAELHNSTVGVDVATGRKYELKGDVLLQCFEIYAVLKAENDVGMSGRQRMCS